MKRFVKVLRTLAFILMILLAMAGIGLPIPFYHQDNLANKKELLEEKEEEEDWLLID